MKPSINTNTSANTYTTYDVLAIINVVNIWLGLVLRMSNAKTTVA